MPAYVPFEECSECFANCCWHLRPPLPKALLRMCVCCLNKQERRGGHYLLFRWLQIQQEISLQSVLYSTIMIRIQREQGNPSEARPGSIICER